MDEAGDRHILPFHGFVDGVLLGLDGQKAVHLLLGVNLDAGRVCLFLVFLAGRLVAHNPGIVRASYRRFQGGLLPRTLLLACRVLLVLFLGSFLGKLAGLDFLLRHLGIAVEADIVALAEEQVLRVVAVPVLAEHGGNLVLGECRLLALRVCDIQVVDDTSVLARLAVVERPKQVHLVAVANVRREEGRAEAGVVVIVVIAQGIMVVQVKAYAEALVDVDAKLGIDMVLAVLLVATRLIIDARIGRKGVNEQELVGLLDGKAVRLDEKELAGQRPVYEDARLACRVVGA